MKSIALSVAWLTLNLIGFKHYDRNDSQPKISEVDLSIEKKFETYMDQLGEMKVEKKKNVEREEEKPKAEPEMNPETRTVPGELISAPSFNTLSGSLPLGTVFILIIIHTCGAGLVSVVSAESFSIFSSGDLINLLFGLITLRYMYKGKVKTAELEKTIVQLQNELEKKEQDNEATDTLEEVKTKLDTWQDELEQKLEDVEDKMKENKQNLHSVEEEIKQEETGDLLKQKEKLLKDQWNLDEAKKNIKRQKLAADKLKEPLENWLSNKEPK